MCFPSSLYQVDFFDSQLTGEELSQAITAHEDKWLADVYAFQRLTDKQYGEPRTCSMVKCLPKKLRDRYYDKYYSGHAQLREDIRK
ncbi:hypothetical protein GCM10028806_56090 [Spirosoma terrae]|uniref:Uncharacterized protein n=1 Tax=Spirosoma terrae TaxID=1968276 RepID=A0A6L9LHH5_9BACT|nr:hypothetical protein [Spirosoma terrae]NDU99227.1 hypothetical protein [Spirosoma terrae]